MSTLSPEELLKPRVMIINPWPDMAGNKVGDIIYVPSDNWIYADGSLAEMDYFESFPHIFKPIPWYANRKESEMPEYVKDHVKVSKAMWVAGVETENGLQPMRMKLDDDPIQEWAVIQSVMCFFEPSNETEYNSYIESLQK